MKFTISIALFLIGKILLGQLLPQFTEYDANLSIYNPAVTGVKGKMYTNFTGRNQWTDVQSNPLTCAGLYEHSIGLNSLGGGYMYDQLGLENNTRVYFNYARTITFEKVKLNIGSSLSYSRKSFSPSSINAVDPNDPSILNLDNPLSHMLGLGLGGSVYNDKFESGLGLANISSNFSTFGSENISRPHLYLNAAYKITTSNYKWRISSLMKTDFSSATVEAQFRSLIKNLVYLGGGARNTMAFHGIIGFQFLKKLRIAYLYEYEQSFFFQNHNTHEIILSWKLE
tara:strand:+ start:292 stop:1143 length:852 start_codon:yes stop_codon:yes gene_type:complete